MDNSYFVYAENDIKIERFHICTWEFSNNKTLVEFGCEVFNPIRAVGRACVCYWRISQEVIWGSAEGWEAQGLASRGWGAGYIEVGWRVGVAAGGRSVSRIESGERRVAAGHLQHEEGENLTSCILSFQ